MRETGVLLRPMRTEDLSTAMRIDAECLPRPWSEAVWREELASPFSRYFVLEAEGEAFAQIGVKHVAGELHVMTIAVLPGYRRRGYARALIEAAYSLYPEVRRVHLEVRPTNDGARALYEALGFTVTGVRRHYYGDEDALLMTLEL